VLLAVAVSLAAAACGTSSARSGSDAVPLRPAGAQGTDATACKPASLDDRVAQVLVVGLPDITDASDPVAQEVLKLGVGGVLLTGGNVVSRSQVTTLVRDLRRQSRHPIVVSTDEETGRVTSFGHLLGASRSARRIAREETPAAMRQEARELASSLSAMGVDLNLAPVADLDDGPYSGIIGDRSFSADPSVTSEFALAFAAGMADGKVRSTAKHFPGHGSATGDDHTGRVTAKATLEDLMATDVAPFGDLIKAGVPVVMMANVDYTALDSDLPASLSPKAYQLLRRMGFTGVAITDSVGMGAVNQRWDVAEAAVAAIKAGADGVLVTDGSMAKHQVRALIQAVNRGVLPEARLNQAAARMTALAGGDPMKFACQPVQLPSLHPTP
jgi:beta-N-acetylhexosaminidase